VAGNLDVGGTGMVNLTNVPQDMLIYGTAAEGAGQIVKLHGNGALTAAVYAPNAALSLKGGGSGGVFNGAAVANTIVIVGNYEFHYDEALNDFGAESSYKINRWRELVNSSERVPLDEPDEMPNYALSYADYTADN